MPNASEPNIPTSPITPAATSSYSIADDGTHLEMGEVGNFEDLTSLIKGVPSAVVTSETAGERLIALKTKFNQLQKKRESYHTQMRGTGGIGAAAGLVTGGVGLFVAAPAVLHQHNQVQKIIKAMRECIEQINGLRTSFADSPNWHMVDNSVKLSEEAFRKKELDTDELVWAKL